MFLRVIFRLLLCLAAVTPALAQNYSDEDLQRAAEKTFGRRNGAIIVMDAQNGRIRAAVNPKLATSQTLPPGSAIKPFVALAALRSGLINGGSQMRCASPYHLDGYHAACVHTRPLPPFDVREALAHSCNFYFGKLGERMTAQQFRAGLAAFGMSGGLPVGNWQPRYAIGDSHDLKVRPAQLLAAYAALANGGKLFAPQQAKPAQFAARLRTAVAMTDEQRRLILEGMRGAVEYGTARQSGLKSLPFSVLGKTGTMLDAGEKEQGWFVGVTAAGEELPQPSTVKLAILVYQRGAKGADCAALAGEFFRELERAETSRHHAAEPLVRVRVGGEIAPLPLEGYVLQVVAAEAGWENEPEALKAAAVAARTYALRHLRRHAREGFDFCNLTHCQRFAAAPPAGISDNLRRAVAATRGQVLTGKNGKLLETYYSASCGGMTADIRALWGTTVPGNYLRGAVDEACAEGPHAVWTDTIAADKLAAALRRDKRSDAGARLDNIIVAHDATGRAQTVTLKGEKTRVLRGWDFKIIVGRGLGWNYLKSSRFTIKKSGTDFIFEGKGFGHGLGLCQEGAHTRAARGASHRQILARYYPGSLLVRRD